MSSLVERLRATPRCCHVYWSDRSTIQGSGTCALCGTNIFREEPMTDVEQLKTRLRQRFESPHPRPVGSLINPDGPEAANEIERLREALEPFANLADANMNDPLHKWLTIAHIKEAGEALSIHEGKPE